jgi:hypothetical protein
VLVEGGSLASIVQPVDENVGQPAAFSTDTCSSWRSRSLVIATVKCSPSATEITTVVG